MSITNDLSKLANSANVLVNSITVNSTAIVNEVVAGTISVGNSVANVVVNSSSISVGGTPLNATSFSGTANNTLYVGSVTAANVVSNAQLQSNVTTIQGQITSNASAAYTNAVAYSDGKSYVNTSQLSSNLANYALLSGGLFTGSVNAASYNVGTTFVANTSGVYHSVNTFNHGTLLYGNGAYVGIGTSSPAYSLDVSGIGRFTGSPLLVGTGASGTAAEIVLNSGSDNKYSDVDFAYGGTTQWRIGINGGTGWGVYSGAGTTNRFNIDTSGNITAANNFYVTGNIYDNQNTGYYVKPSSTSVFNGLTVASTITGSVSGAAVYINGAGAPTSNVDSYLYSGCYFWYPGVTGTPPDAGYGTIFSFVNAGTYQNNTNNWLVQLGFNTSGTVGYFRTKTNASAFSAWNTFIHSANYSSYSNFGTNAVTGSIFYDGNNTAFYCDPASTTVLSSVTGINATWTPDQPVNTNIVADTTNGFRLRAANYTAGQYDHRFVKPDMGGGIPLYIQQATGTAGTWSNCLRVGAYSGQTDMLYVYGSIQSTGGITVPGSSAATNGYTKLVNGIIIQWGQLSVAANATATGTFPLTWPSGCQSIQACHGSGGIWQSYTQFGTLGGATIVSTTQFQISNTDDSTITYYWMAIGY